MSVEWKNRLLETTRRTMAPAEQAQVIRDVVDRGDATLADVAAFLAERKDVFGDVFDRFSGGGVAAQKAAETLLDSTSSRFFAESATTTAGRKAHAVRFDPAASLPWFARAQLPAVPHGGLDGARGAPVVVEGERFTAHDVAELLKLVA